MNPYERNVAALKIKFPAVYAWLSKEADDPNIEVVATPKGLNNLRVPRPTGEFYYLYGEDPLGEEKERCRDMEFPAGNVSFVIGIGLGYFFEAIKERIKRGHKIIVFEKSASIMKKALGQMDLVRLLDEDILIFSLPDEAIIKAQVIQFTLGCLGNINVIAGTAKIVELNPEYGEWIHLVYKNVTNAKSIITGAEEEGWISAKNAFANIPKTLFAGKVDDLYNTFQKIPAVVISAGPSLEENVQALKRAEGNALLVATAPVVRVLLANDIRPDLIVSIDHNEGNRLHFEDLWDLQDIPLVYLLTLSATIVRDFQGPLFAINDPIAWFSPKQGSEEKQHASMSVANCALQTTISLGCDPIVLVGQDLSYSDKTHVAGSARSRDLSLILKKEVVFWQTGLYGKTVLTSNRFLGFLSELENTIENQDRKFINATAQGLPIKGTQLMSLEDCLQQYCQKRIDKRIIHQKFNVLDRLDWEALVKDLKMKIDGMKEMSHLCAKGLKAHKKITTQMKAGFIEDPTLPRLLDESVSWARRLNHYIHSFSILSFLMIKEIKKINASEINRMSDGREKIKITQEMRSLLFSSAQRNLQDLIPMSEVLLTRLTQIKKTREQLHKQPNNARVRFSYGKFLEEMDLSRWAVEEYTRSLELGHDPSPVYEALGRAYHKLGELARAQEYLNRARGAAKDPESIQRSLQAIEEELQGWLGKAESSLQEGHWVNALLYVRKVLREYPGMSQAQTMERAAKNLRDEKNNRFSAIQNQKPGGRTPALDQDLLAQGKKYFQQKNFGQAIEVLEKKLGPEGKSLESESLLACCYAEMGNMDRAKSLFSGLIQRFPRNPLLHANFGLAYLRNGRPLEAAEELETAFRQGENLFHLLLEAGVIYMNAQQYDRALRCFEKFAREKPDHFELLTKIGTCYLAQGRLGEAKEKYAESLRIHPGYLPAQIGLQKIARMENLPSDRWGEIRGERV